MGSMDDSNWSWCYPCEQPMHRINTGDDTYAGGFEVRQAQCRAVMNPRLIHPIEEMNL